MTKQEYNILKEISNNNKETERTISFALRRDYELDRETLAAASYTLYRACRDNINMEGRERFFSSLKTDWERTEFLKRHLMRFDDKSWKKLREKKDLFSSKIRLLESELLFGRDNVLKSEADTITPESVIALAERLLELQDGDSVADFGFGEGAFTTKVFLDHPSLQLDYYGVEIDPDMKEIASIKMEILGCPVELQTRDILKLDTNEKKYRKIFSHFPFLVNVRDGSFDRSRALKPDFSQSVSSDWFFSSAVVSCLEEGGKAVVLMTLGSLFNGRDASARKAFVEQGLIEKVIELPPKLMQDSGIWTALVVLSRGNRDILMVDLASTEFFEPGRRLNDMMPFMDKIEKTVREENPSHCCRVSREMITSDYSLYPAHYLEMKEASKTEIFELGEAINEIRRGAPLTAQELDQIVTKEETPYRYFRLANISDGRIKHSFELECVDVSKLRVKNPEEYLDKYCLKEGTRYLVLSKNGLPFKAAVVEVPKGINLLASGNLYFLTLNEKRVNPFYVKAFLDSEMGAETIKRFVKGSTIPTLSVEAVKKLPIPKVSLEEQNTFGEEYRHKVQFITECEQKIQRAKNTIDHLMKMLIAEAKKEK